MVRKKVFGVTIQTKTTALLNHILINKERSHLVSIVETSTQGNGQTAQTLISDLVFMEEGSIKITKKPESGTMLPHKKIQLLKEVL